MKVSAFFRPSLAFVALVLVSANAFSAGEVKHYQVPVSAGNTGKVSIYLPEGYGESSVSYPVLYLLHGTGGDDLTFLGGGYSGIGGAMSDANVSVIADRLLEQGKIKPLIVACPALGLDEDVLRYFVPFVDSTFRTIPKRESRAIAGHSTGGRSAIYVALLHPEAFSVAGGFSSTDLIAGLPYGVTTEDLRLNPVLFWLYAGTQDHFDTAQPNREFVSFLRDNGLTTTYVEDEGDHISEVPKRLGEFLEYLSKWLKW